MDLNFLLEFVNQNPKVAAVLISIGAARLFIKPIMEIAKAVASLTPSDKDDKVIADVEQSKIYSSVLFVLDWLLSIKKIEKK